MKYLFLLLGILVMSCSTPTSPTETFQAEISIESNLIKDANGYFHLDVVRSNQQTLHRISLNTNYDKSTRVEWFANSSWIYNHMGFDFDVPVINGVSYTSPDDGSAQTMFAPVIELVGDTVTVIAVSGSVADSVRIVLD